MEAFLASDVLYDRARAEIQGVLAEEEIGEKVGASRFLPEPVERWLDSAEVTLTLTFAAETGNVPGGIHGVELQASIDRTTLLAETENTVGIGNDPPELTVEVQNGGDSRERDVTVNYSFSGGVEPIEGETTIPRIDAQGIAEATVPLETSRPTFRSPSWSRSCRSSARRRSTTTRSPTRSPSTERRAASGSFAGHASRLPRPGRDLQRGRAAKPPPRAAIEALPMPTIYDAITAVDEGRAERARPVRELHRGIRAGDLGRAHLRRALVTIIGEHDQPISNTIARRSSSWGGSRSWSPTRRRAQCARFIRAELPGAEVRAAPSTAEAVREVAGRDEPWAALGGTAAARIYDCVVLREGVEDDAGNVTRFVWLAPPEVAPRGTGPWKTTLSFSELGADHPGALVEALTEFSSRAVNLTRIESRPLRRGPRPLHVLHRPRGRGGPSVSDAIEALRGKAENVRVLGSYPLQTTGVPGA